MTKSYLDQGARSRLAYRLKVGPSLMLKAFGVFGAFATVASQAVANLCGYALTHNGVGYFGFAGALLGALYAAIFERHSSDK